MILNVITTPTNGVCFYGDSVISSFNVENNPHITTWTLRLFYDPSYAYPGDLVSESYAGKILATDMQTDEQIQAVAAKLASFPVQKYWFEGGFNDYAFAHFDNRPDLTLVGFTDKYQKLIDYLHDLKPTAKIFVQTIVETYYTLANAETVVDPNADPLIYSGPTAEDYRMVQRIIAGRRSNYCEFVDFTTEDLTFKGVYGETPYQIPDDDANGTTNRANIFYQYVPDGAHPNIEGSIKWAEAVKKRSSLFGPMTNPVPIKILTEELPTDLNKQAHKQTTLKPVINGEVFSHYLTAANGFGAVTMSVSGTLPAGLTFNTITGHLSGTVTAAINSTYNFTISATDAQGRTGSRTFTGTVEDPNGGSEPNPESVSLASVVTSDVYDAEWSLESPSSYTLVNKTATVINPTSNPSTGKAGLFAYFASGNGGGTGTLSFKASGTGVMEVIIFNSVSLAKVARQTFTLTGTSTLYTMVLSLTPETEYRVGLFFSGDGVEILANNARDVVIEKNFSINFTGSNFYGLTGNYIRLRWDENSILGNGYTNWSGRKGPTGSDRYVPAKKFLKHSSWAFMRLLNTNATKLVIEWVSTSSTSQVLGVFENSTYTSVGAWNKPAQLINRSLVTLTSPGTTRKLDVVSMAQGMSLDASNNYVDHLEFAESVYIRAIYINEDAEYSLDTTPHPESVTFIGDSIINTVDYQSPQKFNWIHDIHRNGSATYNYPGDIFTDSAGARSLGQDLQDPTRRELLVQRLIKMGAKKIYIEGSTNDFWASGNGRTYVTSTVFKANYKAFVDRLLEVIPGCKIFIHVQYRFNSSYESALNTEGLNFAQWRNVVRSIYNENYASNPQVELVDFEPIWTVAESGTYLSDGIHPNYPVGQAKLAAELIARSNIETPLVLSFSPGSLPNVTVNNPFSQTFTATNGTGPYTFSVAPGSTLPAWLTLTGNVLSGTAPATTSTSSFSIRVTDSVGATFTKAFTLTVVVSNMTLSPTTLSPAVREVAYSQALTVSGTSNPVTFSASSLPTGLSINSTTGLINGTPAIGNTTGNYTVTITVNDGYNSQNFTRTLSLSGAALTISPSSITPPQRTVFFTQTFTTTGGTAPYTYSVSGQPTGLTMSSGGVLSGTPSAEGSFTFTVTSTDSLGNVGTRVISTTVQAAPPTVKYSIYNAGGFVAVSGTLNKPGGGGFTSLFRTIVALSGPGGYIGTDYIHFAAGSTTSTTNYITTVPFASGTYNVTTTYDESYGTGVFQGVTLTYLNPDVIVVP